MQRVHLQNISSFDQIHADLLHQMRNYSANLPKFQKKNQFKRRINQLQSKDATSYL